MTNKAGPLKFLQVEGYAEALSGIIEFYDPKHVERIKTEVFIEGDKGCAVY